MPNAAGTDTRLCKVCPFSRMPTEALCATMGRSEPKVTDAAFRINARYGVQAMICAPAVEVRKSG